MATLNSLAGNPIRVSVPATVAFDPKAFKISVASLMGKLGCGKCFSGFDCHFHLQRDYVVDPADFKKIDDAPAAHIHSGNVVNMSLGRESSYNLAQINKIIDSLHGKFGCAPAIQVTILIFKMRSKNLRAFKCNQYEKQQSLMPSPCWGWALLTWANWMN